MIAQLVEELARILQASNIVAQPAFVEIRSLDLWVHPTEEGQFRVFGVPGSRGPYTLDEVVNLVEEVKRS